jgi:HEAT repeat protein
VTPAVDRLETIASLIDSLNHSQKRVSRKAADALIEMAATAPEVSPELERLLQATRQGNRWAIAYVLGHIATPSEACLDALIEALGNADPDIRWAACVLLTRWGKSDRSILARFAALLKSGTPTQRRMAAYCIRDSDRERAYLRALLDSLTDADPLVRVAAVTSLKSYSTIGAVDLDLLLRYFREDPDARVRRGAALTLGRLGSASEKVKRALDDACRSEDPLLGKAARAALAEAEKKGPAKSN